MKYVKITLTHYKMHKRYKLSYKMRKRYKLSYKMRKRYNLRLLYQMR